MKLPKTLGSCVDLLYKMREERLAAQKVVDERKAQEHALKDHILTNLNSQGGTTFGGKIATAHVSKRTEGTVHDWDDFFNWVAKTDSWDMVQKRINNAAYRERLENDVDVPGVEAVEVTSINLTKK